MIRTYNIGPGLPPPGPDLPPRVRLLGTADFRLPDDAVRCDAASMFGNPFLVCGSVSHITVEWWVENPETFRQYHRDPHDARAAAIKLHRVWIMRPEQHELRALVRDVFRARRPACWCRLDAPCHGDTLAQLADVPARQLNL